ncbi:MAG: glycerophosphodiester phosphodiesterase [Gammaproteobacteria bacterium]
MHTSQTSRLVAHRGDHKRASENSLAAFQEALEAGAHWLECDVQFTRDAVPVIFHDETMQRMCRREDKIGALRQADLPLLLDGQAVPQLQELLTLLGNYAHARLYLELKCEILHYYSVMECIDELDSILCGNEQVIPISMSAEFLEYCWHIRRQPLGWIPAGRVPDLPLAYLLMPAEDFLRGVRPTIAEEVVVYTVNKAQFARQLLQQGADLVETDHFSHLKQHMHEN